MAVAAVVALSGSLAACSGGGSTSPSAQGSGGGKVTLTFWNGFTGGDRPGVEHLVSQFNSTHKDIQIQMQIMPWDVFYQKLLPAYGSGKGPDLTAMDSNQLPVYAAKGVFQPLDDIFSGGGLDKNKLVKGGVDAGQYQGKQYGIPANFTPTLLYYNKDLLNKAGITSPPANWSQWVADLRKLTLPGGANGKPKQYGMALGVHDTIEVLPILLWENGGGITSPDGKKATLDSPASVQAVKYWAHLITQDHISPIGLSGADADKLMSSGNAAMEVNGPWLTSTLDEAKINYGVSMVPAGPRTQTTLADSVQFSLSSKADPSKKKAAETFLSYWNSATSQKYFAKKTGFPPTRTDVSPSELGGNPALAQFAMYSSKGQTLLPGNQHFAQIQTEVFDPTIEKILNNKGDVGSLLTQANQQLEPLLAGS